jgi:hypothetical protein
MHGFGHHEIAFHCHVLLNLEGGTQNFLSEESVRQCEAAKECVGLQDW